MASPRHNNNGGQSGQQQPPMSRSQMLAQLNDLAGIHNSENLTPNHSTHSLASPPNHRTTHLQHQQHQPLILTESKIDYLSTVPAPTGVKFTKQARFQPNTSQFGSATTNTELFSSSSPGPIYSPSYTQVLKRATHAVAWKESKLEQLRLQQQQQQQSRQHHHNPPTVLLHPNVDALASHPTPPRAVLGTSARFVSDVQVSATQSVSMLLPQYTAVEKSQPAYSFGNPLDVKARRLAPSKPRTQFMTHNINGGLARPATLEANIGPGDYTPAYDTVAHKAMAVTRNLTKYQNMGSAARFEKPSMFTSPGPLLGHDTKQMDQPRSGVHWL